MGEAQGKKVASTALRLRRSRRSRSSARSSHHRGPVRRVLKRNLGRRGGQSRLGCTRGLNGLAKRKKRSAGNGEIIAESDRQEHRRCTSMRSGTEIHSTRSKRWGKTIAFFRSSPEHPSRRFARTCSTTRVKRSSLSRGGRENWLRTVADRPARFDWSGLREDGQTRPRCAADKDRTDASEDLPPNERRHADLRHR
jgi:hypothetical protein